MNNANVDFVLTTRITYFIHFFFFFILIIIIAKYSNEICSLMNSASMVWICWSAYNIICTIEIMIALPTEICITKKKKNKWRRWLNEMKVKKRNWFDELLCTDYRVAQMSGIRTRAFNTRAYTKLYTIEGGWEIFLFSSSLE